MKASYNRLWKRLIDENMMKRDLCNDSRYKKTTFEQIYEPQTKENIVRKILEALPILLKVSV